jgi:hypothetical protein
MVHKHVFDFAADADNWLTLAKHGSNFDKLAAGQISINRKVK